jgi:hypothetical protein
MARSKERWLAVWRSVGVSRGAESYAIHIGCELPREPGRTVHIYLDPDKAESLGRSLVDYADKVRKMNSGQPANVVIGPWIPG